MKTNGATWKAYMNSWPKGQWFDDSDETYDGVTMSDFVGDEYLPSDTAVVEVTCGVVFKDENDRQGMSLLSHFRAWLKSQSHETVVCDVPKERLPEFLEYIKGINGNRRAAA